MSITEVEKRQFPKIGKLSLEIICIIPKTRDFVHKKTLNIFQKSFQYRNGTYAFYK